jgi:hypothetical protein
MVDVGTTNDDSSEPSSVVRRRKSDEELAEIVLGGHRLPDSGVEGVGASIVSTSR